MPNTAMSLDSLHSVEALERLRQQGVRREVDPDGSVYSSIGTRIPPPSLMRKIHAQRQEDRNAELEANEADDFERQKGMGVVESRMAFHERDDGKEARKRRLELALATLDCQLTETACRYEVVGCGLSECDGAYHYCASTCRGAPVYKNESGWTLYRDRPPVEASIGTDDIKFEFGWLICKERRPFYAAMTEEFLAPETGWQCFLGPPPEPRLVAHTTWEQHLLTECVSLKDAGNKAFQDGRLEDAQALYSQSIDEMDGYPSVESDELQALRTVLRANRAEVYLRLSQWDGACDDCLWILDRDAGHVKAVVRLTKACRALGRWAEAVSRLTTFLKDVEHSEVRALYVEFDLLSRCDEGASPLSSLYQDLLRVKSGAASMEEVVTSVQNFQGDAEELTVLFRSFSVVDTIVNEVDMDSPPWVSLLGVCASTANESEFRQILRVLPQVMPRFADCPVEIMYLVRHLLRHPLSRTLKVADQLVEMSGLPGCLRTWARLLDGDGTDAVRTVEVFRELQAQTTKSENVGLLAVALFVECFVGERTERGITGGFVLYSGSAVRQVVTGMLRDWAADAQVLQSLRPDLVARVWQPTGVKLRREASLEVERAVGRRKLEWFKLRSLDRVGFYPEDLLVALLDFLSASLAATGERGHEVAGIAARHPAEEWMEDVLDKPFGWGLLLPLTVGPPFIARRSVALLEQLVLRHPHTEMLAKRLAGLHLFLPLLSLPWPPTEPAESNLEALLQHDPCARRSFCVVLRCVVDTEVALRVARDHPQCMDAALSSLKRVLEDRDTTSLIAAVETFAILASATMSWEKIDAELISHLLCEFLQAGTSRHTLAKFFRYVCANPTASALLHSALEANLNEEQREKLMAEVFETKTPAGQLWAQRMTEVAQQCDQPEVEVPSVSSMVATLSAALVDARVLVIGRLARVIAPCLSHCRVVLGDTTLRDLGAGMPNVEHVMLPLPQCLAGSAVVQEHFDVVISGEPMGCCDLFDYADHLKAFITRSPDEDTCTMQWICIERRERMEDARDDLYAAGYYNADHVELASKMSRAALNTRHRVMMFSLPSAAKERRRQRDVNNAERRKMKRIREEERAVNQAEAEERRRAVLCETLFDPVLSLSQSDSSCLPIVFDVGPRDAVSVFFWLHGDGEDPQQSKLAMEELAASSKQSLRVIAVTYPSGVSRWFRWTDETAVNFGIQWFELAAGPTEDDAKRAAKEPARNISFVQPSFEEAQILEEMEPCCKQLLNLAEETANGAKIFFGGFSQGASVAAYAALGGLGMHGRQIGLVLCCAGVPVFHFLASKIQTAWLQGFLSTRIHMIYGKDLVDNYVNVAKSTFKRFEIPVTLTRFETPTGERFPSEIRLPLLLQALGRLNSESE